MAPLLRQVRWIRRGRALRQVRGPAVRRVYEWTSFARVTPFTGELHRVGMVSEGATTPWKWTSLPGLSCQYDECAGPHYYYVGSDPPQLWLTSERREERR